MVARSERRIVIDASLAIDLFAGRDKNRVDVAEKVFRCLRADSGDVRLHAPRLFVVEVAGVLARFIPASMVREVLRRLGREITFLGDDLYFRESVEIAMKTGSRGADAYYIGLASVLSAVLLTSDRVQALNAKRAGVQAYYALEEADRIFELVGCHR